MKVWVLHDWFDIAQGVRGVVSSEEIARERGFFPVRKDRLNVNQELYDQPPNGPSGFSVECDIDGDVFVEGQVYNG
jgi:hypothetical protein